MRFGGQTPPYRPSVPACSKAGVEGVASRIGTLRRKVALGEYELTGHAKEEMEQDRFTISDVKSAIYSGRIVGTQRRGGGGRRDVVQGKAVDERVMRVVCRVAESGRMRIVTVFAV